MFEPVRKFSNKPFSPIFLYHSTFTSVPESLGNSVHNVTPDNLYKQVKWLKENYDIVHVDELFEEPFTPGRCAITFDDAYNSVFEEGIPVLGSLKAPATIFVNGATLAGGIFWRDKIRILLSLKLENAFASWASAFCKSHHITVENFYKATKNPRVNSRDLSLLVDEFYSLNSLSAQDEVRFCIGDKEKFTLTPLIKYGNHTYYHYVLSSLPKDIQRDEIITNERLLAECIAPENLSKIFSIPFGGLDTFNADTIEILKQQGYKGALLSRSKLNPAYRSKLPKYEGIPMLERMMPHDNWDDFKRQMRNLKIRSLPELLKDQKALI